MQGERETFLVFRGGGRGGRNGPLENGRAQTLRDCHPFALLRASAYFVARNDNLAAGGAYQDFFRAKRIRLALRDGAQSPFDPSRRRDNSAPPQGERDLGLRPSAVAQKISDWSRFMSPAVETPGALVIQVPSRQTLPRVVMTPQRRSPWSGRPPRRRTQLCLRVERSPEDPGGF